MFMMTLACSPWADTENGGYAGAFMQLPVQARPAAMGGAYFAVSNDAAGQIFNPAGISAIRTKLFSSSYRAMKLDRKLGFVSVVFPTRLESSLGLSWLYAGYGEVETRNRSGILTGGTVGQNEHAFAISFAKLFLPYLSLGTRLNYYYNRLGDITANSVGINLGIMLMIDSLFEYGTMDEFPIANLKVGLVLNNLAAKYPWESEGAGLAPTQDDEFPKVVGGGFSLTALQEKLLIAGDLEKNFEQNLRARIGGEYQIDDRFLLRSGLNNGIFTAGAGFRFVLKELALSLDYAFSDDRVDEGSDHIITFNIFF